MPFNGSGVYTAPSNSWNPAVSSTTIDPADWNSTQQDYETALSTTITKDGQTNPTANLPMAGYKHTGVAATSGGASRTEYTSGGVAQDGVISDAGDTGGTSTAFTATLSPAISAYADKACYRVKFNAAFGANPTINFNSIGAKKMYANVAGSAVQLTTNDVPDDYVGILRYDSTLDAAAGAFWLLNPVPDTFSGGTITSTLTMSGAALNEAKGADIPSATTTDIGAATGNFVHITGTTTITGLGTVQAGTQRIVTFDGILTLTHNGTSLILPTGANITTAAGDCAIFVSEGSGNWRCVDYQRANGRALATIGGYEFIATFTASGAATLDVSGLTNTAYTEYLMVVENLIPATDDVALRMLVSTDGVTFPTTNYLSLVTYNVGGSTGGTTATDGILMVRNAASGNIANDSTGWSGEVKIFPRGSSVKKQVNIFGSYDSASAGYAMINAAGIWTGSNDPITHVRFVMSSGNETGTVRLYGLRNS